jgi:propionyl-CoA carboxylase alpha chain
MFSKILIANRGEIACRVIKTAKRLGVKTVAVYSDADAGTPHVLQADEAVAIGPAPAAESYLVAERIIQAAKDTGAEAIHPGFGFLSENAGFARAVAEAGLVFIGPPPSAIDAMGDKIESKRLAKEAGVSTVPGSADAITDPEEVVRIANEIGYPVMLKASAGGGGKGMRIAFNDDEARDGLVRAASEAKSSFGDDRVFVEKFVVDPRHIEIQVLADSHGNTVHLFERECSIQRRHQKVVEEAPSPFLDAETRAAMGAQAVALAAAVGYQSAGTVEFIVGPNRDFYFLEMNTRLQVEHPVTELITGLDLVEQMLRVASGEKLGFGQDDLKINGWALECRLYAEDPTRNFSPSIGRLTRYRPPVEKDGVRVDTGVAEGGKVSMFYDPMLAKLCTHGVDRNEAINRMTLALDRFQTRGIRHNLTFLSAIVDHPRHRSGNISTAFIEEEFPEGFENDLLADARMDIIAPVIATRHAANAERDRALAANSALTPPPLVHDYVVLLADVRREVSVTLDAHGAAVVMDGQTIHVAGDPDPAKLLFEGDVGDIQVAVQIDRDGPGYIITHGGVEARALVLTPDIAALHALMPEKLPPDTSNLLLSPMPGLLKAVMVEAGDTVEPGQALAIVEAMKMENVLRAEKTAEIAVVEAEAGASLAADQVILTFVEG